MGNKKETIGIRCEPELKRAIEQAAESERRTVSNFMLNAAIERMNQDQVAQVTENRSEIIPKPVEKSESILTKAKHKF